MRTAFSGRVNDECLHVQNLLQSDYVNGEHTLYCISHKHVCTCKTDCLIYFKACLKNGPLGMAGEYLHGNAPQGRVTKLWNRYVSIKKVPLIIKVAVLQTKPRVRNPHRWGHLSS